MGDVPSAKASSDVKDDFKIKGVASNSNGKDLNTEISERSDATSEVCSICLETITERAVAIPCNHLAFDFICLVSWLQEQAACPLCKTAVKEVQYDFRSPDDWKTYYIPVQSRLASKAYIQSNRRIRHSAANHVRPSSSEAHGVTVVPDPGVNKRRQIYRHRLYSLHVGNNEASGYKDVTAKDIAQSPITQSRARAFLRRELQVFTWLAEGRRGSRTRDYLLEYIMALIKLHDLKGADGQAQALLQEQLGAENANILLHEMLAWLRSPYTTVGQWDEHTQYPVLHEGDADEQPGSRK